MMIVFCLCTAIMPFSVQAEPGDNVCEIDGVGYTTLDNALADVQSGEDKTIKLLGSIDYDGGIVVENKSITFDLNGYTLNVVNNAEEDTFEEMSGLYVKGNAAVDLTGEGEFNVTGSWYGLFAECDNDTGESPEVTVTNVIGNGRDGVAAQGGAKVTVKGNVTSNGSNDYEYSGVWASDVSSMVTVEGDVYANGDLNTGVKSDESAFVEVKGDVIVNGTGSIGIKAGEDGDVTVNGNITVTGDDCTGVYLTALAGMPSIVTIKGEINATKYVLFEDEDEEPFEQDFEYGDYDSETSEESRYYTIDYESFVYVSMFAGGSGTAEDPYLIANGTQLANIGDHNFLREGYHYKQTANIDLGGYFSLGQGFKPIGHGEVPFLGIYDGDGHTISNLKINRTDVNFVGLFGLIGMYSEIRNVGLIDANITGERHVGALAGENTGSVINSYAAGTVNGLDNDVGGLIGANYGEITDSYFVGTVAAEGNYIGGLTGVNSQDAIITDCYAEAAVTSEGEYGTGGLVGVNYSSVMESHAICTVVGNEVVGGLVGENTDEEAIIWESYADGNVTGTSQVGGLAGNSSSTINDSYFTGTVTGSGSYTGGLVGDNSGPITDSHADVTVTSTGDYVGGLAGTSPGSIMSSYSTGSVTGKSYVGGLAGEIHTSFSMDGIIASHSTCTVEGEMYVGGLAGSNEADIFSSFAKGDVASTDDDELTYTYFGGLVGNNTGPIENSYAWGDVSGNQYIGGLIGYNQADIANCYEIGKVTGDSEGNAGPLMGYSDPLADITGSFWNNNTSGHTTSSYGIEAGSGSMKQAATYNKAYGDEIVEWDFDAIWDIANSTSGYNDGYPYLKWELPEEFGGGSGTEDDPYLIYTDDHLNNVRNHLDKHFRQMADLDLSFYRTGSGWEPIGTAAAPFTGTFDGEYHTISALFIEQNDNTVYTGLFGCTGAEAEIRTLGLENVDVTGSGETGGLTAINNGMIENCYVTGAVTGTWDDCVGGLVAENEGTILNCHTDVTVSGGDIDDYVDYVGGLAGQNFGSIRSSSSAGEVTGDDEVGGLVGFNCAYQGSAGEISGSYSTCDVMGVGNNVGGLVGNNDGPITYSCAAGSVTGEDNVGGLAGMNCNTITDSYAVGDVAGDDYIGGLVGYNTDLLTNCYSAGTVTDHIDSMHVGGLVGDNDIAGSSEGAATDSYWDLDASGQTESACGTGKTTAEMKQLTTFENWDFIAIWDISADFNEGYPFLKWQDAAPPVISNAGVDSVTETTATLSFTSNRTGLYYYLVYKAEYDAPVPDAAAIKAQGDGAIAKGSGTAAAAVNEIALTNFTASTEYNAYIIVEYAQGNISDVAEINFSTQAPPSGPGVAPLSLSITTGGTGVFTVSLGYSENGADSAIVTSNDTGIAMVSPSIVNTSGQAIAVTGISAGNTTVTVAFSGGNYTGDDIIVNVTVTDPISDLCEVNFFSNGIHYADITVTSGAALGISWPSDPTRSKYSFGGWFTGQNGAGTQYTSSTIITADVDLYAKWTYSGGGGGGGGTPSVPTIPAAPDYSAEVKKGSSTETTLPVTVKKETRTASIDTGPQNLNREGTAITIPSIPDVDTYTVGIPVPDLSTALVQGILTLNTDAGSIAVPSNMLTGVEDTDGNKAQITIGQGDKTNLPKDVRNYIADRPLVQLTLSIDGRQTEWSNQEAPVTISIPYTPTAAELANSESIVVWYIDGSGKAVCVPNGHYDPATGMVTFTTTHFSNFAVAYNKVSFNDVASGAWYSQVVSFIAAREITTGTGGGNFSPSARLTRGEFIVMLMKAYGIGPDAEPEDNFADAGAAYYTGYLAAAKRLSISAGVGNNLFAPKNEITRQEMFTLICNALKVIDELPQGKSGKTLSDFNDAGQIATWAKDAVTLLVRAGTVGGSNGKLSPLDTATRAEMAQVLYNLLSK